MKLLKLKFTNFRRFVEPSTILINDRLIALIGPNEAGKSTILDGIQKLGTQTPPSANDRSRVNLSQPAIISGLYQMDPKDLESVSDIHQFPLGTVGWVHLKDSEDEPVWEIEGMPQPSSRSRRDMHRALLILDRNEAISGLAKNPSRNSWNSEMISDARAILRNTRGPLQAAQIEPLQRLLDSMKSFYQHDISQSNQPALRRRYIDTFGQLIEDLSNLIDYETNGSPVRRISTILNKRLPSAITFSPAKHVLKERYSLNEAASSPGNALSNLAGLASLDLREVAELVKAGRIPQADSKINRANENARMRFQSSWRQHLKVYPRFALRDESIEILVTTEDEDFSYPTERSEGFRWFLALVAFLFKERGTHPILLIDEAETHLHYDAQADLVDTLMAQNIAATVVYTTHSVGCLPPDLGRGIRAIVPRLDSERSDIYNSYWSLGDKQNRRVGYEPLLLAMGANLLALTVPRYALVTEGPSEAILLPTLIRLATGTDSLPYRVVPGISEIANSFAHRLEASGVNVAYLVDGDDGGRKNRDKLLAAGIEPNRILSLEDMGCKSELEDLVHPGTFLAAVNAEIQEWSLGNTISTLPPNGGKWAWLKSNFQKSASISKIAVAQRIVDLLLDIDLPDHTIPSEIQEKLDAMHEELQEVLSCTD
jgi:hypothetical protein